MDEKHSGREYRRLRVETVLGPVEGLLAIGGMLRTLDDLNVAAKPFIVLEGCAPAELEGAFRPGSLAINKSLILFVHELDAPPDTGASRPAGARLTRAMLRLRVGAFDIDGFVHVPPGGSALARLNQPNHAFVSLTSASVVGAAAPFAAPFLAVHRLQVIAAQELVDTAGDVAEPALSFELAE